MSFILADQSSYMSPNAGGGGVAGVSDNESSCAHGAQINSIIKPTYGDYKEISSVWADQ
jgi:hypothetical protein